MHRASLPATMWCWNHSRSLKLPPDLTSHGKLPRKICSQRLSPCLAAVVVLKPNLHLPHATLRFCMVFCGMPLLALTESPCYARNCWSHCISATASVPANALGPWGQKQGCQDFMRCVEYEKT